MFLWIYSIGFGEYIRRDMVIYGEVDMPDERNFLSIAVVFHTAKKISIFYSRRLLLFHSGILIKKETVNLSAVFTHNTFLQLTITDSVNPILSVHMSH